MTPPTAAELQAWQQIADLGWHTEIADPEAARVVLNYRGQVALAALPRLLAAYAALTAERDAALAEIARIKAQVAPVLAPFRDWESPWDAPEATQPPLLAPEAEQLGLLEEMP